MTIEHAFAYIYLYKWLSPLQCQVGLSKRWKTVENRAPSGSRASWGAGVICHELEAASAADPAIAVI